MKKLKNKDLKLFKLLQKIPKGKITTYKILAQKLKIHPRTAGIILKNNEDPILYPCYKVVASNGKLGGYNLGEKKKIQFLKRDGIKIKGDKVINFTERLHAFDNKS